MAVALLGHYLNDRGEALKLAKHFHEFVLAKLPFDFWRLSLGDVGEAVSRIRAWQGHLISRISQ